VWLPHSPSADPFFERALLDAPAGKGNEEADRSFAKALSVASGVLICWRRISSERVNEDNEKVMRSKLS
jgi:hypothetical protein